MHYLLLLYSDETGWTRQTPAEQKKSMAAYQAYAEALVNAGALKATHRLQSASLATTVRVTNGKHEVMDGPFADSKEQIGGYFLIDVPDLDAALSWAARCPGASHGTVEVRPVWSPS